MSIPEADLPPLSFQKAVIDADFNANVLFIFSMGIYTMVYFSTLYIYLNKRLSHSSVVISFITMLYVVNVAQLGVQWFFLKWIFINNGESQEAVFLAIFTQSNAGFWLTIGVDICQYLLTILADALLIWRCFHIWNRSFKVIILPLFLLLAEAGIYLYIIILPCIKQSNLSDAERKILNRIQSAEVFVSFVCTLGATALIAYRIYPIFNQDLSLGRAKGRFKQILDTVVQSAAAYVVVSLLQAIASVIDSNGTVDVVFLTYLGTLYSITAGLAPTLLVARIALASDKSEISTTPHLSVLQFQGRSTHQTTRSRVNDTPAGGEEGGSRETVDDIPEMKSLV